MVRNILMLLLVGFIGVLGYYTYEEYNKDDASIHLAQTRVKQRVKVEIYGTRSCRYCVMAKQLFAQKGLTYEDHDVDIDEKAHEMMARTGNASSVPQIFIGEKHIGGYGELAKLNQEGTLDLMLAGEKVHLEQPSAP
jgi:glutaredoxin 3